MKYFCSIFFVSMSENPVRHTVVPSYSQGTPSKTPIGWWKPWIVPKQECLRLDMCVCVCVLVAHLCPALCQTSMDCSLPDSSVQGNLQARILEWVAIPFSRRSSQPRD